MKHWTEPYGNFIINIPIKWQYRNSAIESIEERSPYSFELYENPIGCFQISCYPLSEKGVNPNFPIQKNNSRIDWLASRMDDEKFNVLLFFAQVDDLLCMAKYIFSKKHAKDKRLNEELNSVNKALETLRVIPKSDRELAKNLNKHDNFLASLAASYDLLYRAIKSDSFIESIVILANQIDAFLRSAIILKNQLDNLTNNIELKYIYQGEDERGINERKIYKDAHTMSIIDDSLFDELNRLYDLRNQVIHRYIISFLKTRDIFKLAQEYSILHEKIRVILGSYEEKQYGKGFGIYGKGYNKKEDYDDTDYKTLYSWINDKHLIKKLNRKI